MNLLNSTVAGYIGGGSMIRRMFEAGIELKKKYGADKVYDFSLGNPDLPPPAAVKAALSRIAARADQPFSVGYMPNGGYPELREKLAAVVAGEQQTNLQGKHLLVTCGAAGGMNVLFHAILEQGDEVLSPSPYFVEYVFYAAAHGGKLIAVPGKDLTFELDFTAWEKAFTPRTRAVILNSPNNPTGRIYTPEEVRKLAEIVAAKEKEYDRPIYLVSDEPYRFLNFENREILPVFGTFPHAVVIGSFSKNLSLAGERIGYIAVAPDMEGADDLMAGLTICNRILGFVNAPALGQQILLEALDSQVDLEIYRERRDAMARVLDAAGVEYTMPTGAFYFFPKSPVADERVFIDALFRQRVLAVPGRGFGREGYFRLAFCVDKKIIENSAEGFAAAVKAVK